MPIAIALFASLFALSPLLIAQDAPETMALVGVCRTEAGAPLARAKVDLYLQDYGRHRTTLERSTLTDEKGRFRFDGAPVLGEADWGFRFWFVRAAIKGRADGVATVRSQNVNPEKLEIAMLPAAEGKGVVVDDNDAPIVGATVWITIYGAWDPLGQIPDLPGVPHYAWALPSEPLPGWAVRTDSKGRFAMPSLPKGLQCTVRVQHERHARKRIDLTAPFDEKVILGPGGTITGRIVRADTGKPVDGAVAQAQGIGQGAWTSVRTDKDGRFRIKSLPPDAYNVWAAAKEWTVVAHAGLGVAGGQIVEAADLELIKGGFIEGRVLDDAGQPVQPGMTADVGLYGPSRPRRGGAIETASIGQNGAFRLRVPPGSNYVYLRVGEGWLAVAPANYTVDVGEGKTAKVTFRAAKK